MAVIIVLMAALAPAHAETHAEYQAWLPWMADSGIPHLENGTVNGAGQFPAGP